MRNFMLRLWRRARTVAVVRLVIAAVDRHWWARVIIAADIVDDAYVTAQLGRAVTARRAVRIYVGGGWRRGMSLNPLLCEQTVLRALSDDERVPAAYAYLVNDRTAVDVSPNWSAPDYARSFPAALDDPAGPVGHLWRAARRTGICLLGRAGRTTEADWRAVHDAAINAVRSGSPIFRSTRGSPTSQVGAGSVAIFRIAGDERDPGRAMTQAVELLGATVDSLRLEVVGREASTRTQAALLTLWSPDTDVVLDAPDHRPGEWSHVHRVVRGPHAEIDVDDLVQLFLTSVDRLVAPLWLAEDGTIASAGRMRGPDGPIDLFQGLPAADARRLVSGIEAWTISSPTYGAPAGRPRRPALVRTDLTVIAPSRSAVTHDIGPNDVRDDKITIEALAARTGLKVLEWRGGEPRLRFSPAVDTRVNSFPRLRWAIRTSSPVGRAGDAWGDTHFARGLAEALERIGQTVAIDAYAARRRASSELDDVTLVLRGPHRIEPPSSGRTLLWVISHPDEIGADELRSFDRVFAASASWAKQAARRTGVVVDPLLQCTDARMFVPTGAPRTRGPLFVGTARGIARPSIVEPIRAGIDVDVYGPDWRAFIPARSIVATGVPHAELPQMYERAAVVLNDHWPAMRANGFIANRPFDVVAAGGRVISDHVVGIDETFDGALRSYRSIPELVELMRSDFDDLFGDDIARQAASERVRREHSFDRRAEQLVAAAIAQ